MFSIPSGVFNKYREVATYMETPECFGTSCKLVFVSKIVSSQQESFGKRLTIRPTGGDRSTEYTDYQEYTEDVVLRVYWDKSSFNKFGNIIIPDGGCMTVCTIDNYDKINKASFLLIFTDLHQTLKFEKASEISPYGLDNKSISCVWKRV